MTKRSLLATAAYGLFLPVVLLVPLMGCAGWRTPPLPPPLVVPVPPPVFLIPGTYAYFAADVDVDLIFFGGFWYRPYGGRWYRASYYNGPWGFVPVGNVPGVLLSLPPGFRNVPPGHQRIPHDQLQMNWRTWERERHWDKPAEREKPKKSAKPKGQNRTSKKKTNGERGPAQGKQGGKGRGR